MRSRLQSVWEMARTNCSCDTVARLEAIFAPLVELRFEHANGHQYPYRYSGVTVGSYM